jgi:hypothetical protein
MKRLISMILAVIMLTSSVAAINPLPNRRLTDAELQEWIANYRATGGANEWELYIIQQINDARVVNNLPPLEVSETIMMATRFYAQTYSTFGQAPGLAPGNWSGVHYGRHSAAVAFGGGFHLATAGGGSSDFWLSHMIQSAMNETYEYIGVGSFGSYTFLGAAGGDNPMFAQPSTCIINHGGHSMGEWTITSHPYCRVGGWRERQCNNCFFEESEAHLPALGHDWGEWEIITEATCDSKGLYRRECQRGSCSGWVGGRGLQEVEVICSCGCVMLGHVRGGEKITILDALEILMYLAGLESMIIPESGSWDAARITGGDTPTISDALEILMYLAGLDCILN